MDTREKKSKDDIPEIVKEFIKRMSVILDSEEKKTITELNKEAEKIKKELKEKYNAQKK